MSDVLGALENDSDSSASVSLESVPELSDSVSASVSLESVPDSPSPPSG